MGSLYRTGYFFFALAYCGSNLLAIARLFKVGRLLLSAHAVARFHAPCPNHRPTTTRRHTQRSAGAALAMRWLRDFPSRRAPTLAACCRVGAASRCSSRAHAPPMRACPAACPSHSACAEACLLSISPPLSPGPHPDSLLHMLESYGPEAFAAALAGDCDTPELVWTHRMRLQRLVPQVGVGVVWGWGGPTRAARAVRPVASTRCDS